MSLFLCNVWTQPKDSCQPGLADEKRVSVPVYIYSRTHAFETKGRYVIVLQGNKALKVFLWEIMQ